MIVDGGALFFDSIRPHRYKFEQIRAKDHGIVEAYNRIGYDAVGVAGQDLAGGLSLLQELARKSNFAWLSGNLVEKESGLPYFQTHISKEVGGVRVAITGLTSPEIAEARLLDEGAAIRNWEEVFPPLVSNLKQNHQFIILLTDLAPDLCAAISRRHPEVNLIIRASGDLENHSPRAIAPSTLIASTGRQGKYVGALTVSWIRGGRWGEPDEDTLLLIEKGADLDRTMSQLNKMAGNGENRTRIGNLERKKEVLAGEVSQLKSRIESRKLSLYTNSFYEMSDTVSDDPGVQAVVMQIRENVAALSRERTDPVAESDVVAPPGYLGWPACLNCHRGAVSTWKETRHAGAYETLVRKNRQNDFDCLPCHLTGIDFDNVASALTLTDTLRTVGCEACHGPGKEHVASEGRSGTGKVSGKVCVRCHVPEHDDSHDFERDLIKIRCNR